MCFALPATGPGARAPAQRRQAEPDEQETKDCGEEVAEHAATIADRRARRNQAEPARGTQEFAAGFARRTTG